MLKIGYEREEENSETVGYQASQGKIPDRYQPTTEKSRSQTMKDPKEDSETGGNASTNETHFKRLERGIEEVAFGQETTTPKIEKAISLFTA